MIAFLNGWILVAVAGILGAVNFMFQPIHNSLLADVTVSENRGIVYGFSAGISFSIGSLAGVIGGYIGDILSINHIFPSMAVFLIPAVFLAIVLKKIL
jgi:MFS family permease